MLLCINLIIKLIPHKNDPGGDNITHKMILVETTSHTQNDPGGDNDITKLFLRDIIVDCIVLKK